MLRHLLASRSLAHPKGCLSMAQRHGFVPVKLLPVKPGPDSVLPKVIRGNQLTEIPSYMGSFCSFPGRTALTAFRCSPVPSNRLVAFAGAAVAVAERTLGFEPPSPRRDPSTLGSSTEPQPKFPSPSLGSSMFLYLDPWGNKTV